MITTSIFGIALTGLSTGTAHADIVKTRITTYTYDFPESTPEVSRNTITESFCSGTDINDGRGGVGGENGGSYGDSDGDGYSDVGGYTSDPPGTDDGYGDNGKTQTSPGMNSGCDGCEGLGGESGGSGGGGSKVICTYFYQKGELDEMLYYADIDYAHTRAHPCTLRGYHTWALWYVRHLRQHPGGLLEKFIRPLMKARALEIGYQMGVVDTPSYPGKLVRLLEYPCFIIGMFVPDYDWKSLYTIDDFETFARGYRNYKAYKYCLARRPQAQLRQIVHRLIPQTPVASAYLALRTL